MSKKEENRMDEMLVIKTTELRGIKDVVGSSK